MLTKITLDNLFKDCNEALDAGNCTLAFSFLERAYPLLLNYPQRNIVWVNYYFNYAVALNNSGDFAKSRTYADKASEIAILNKDEYLTAKAECLLASSFLNIGDFLESFEHANLALRLFNKLNKNEDKAEVLMDLGKINLRQGDWRNAIKNYSEALFIAKKFGNKRIEGKAFMSLGYIFRAHRFLYLAIDHYRDAEKIYKSINFTQGLVMALYERANTYLSLRKPEMTDRIMKEIESLTPSDSTMRMFLLKLQYCIHNQNLEFSKALVCADQLLEFFKKAKDRRGEAECYEMIASGYYNISQMDNAQYFGEVALQISKEIGDQILQSTCQQLLHEVSDVINGKINLDEIRNS